VSFGVGVLIGLGAALVSAFAANLGFLWRHRGAVEAPEVDITRPIGSAVGLFRQTWWTVGYLTAVGAWGLHVAALSLAPLSLVQAVLAGGFVFLAVLADRVFGFRLRKREWIGISLVALALALLAVTAGQSAESARSNFGLAAMIAFESALVGLGTLCILSQRVSGGGNRGGIMLGAAAGALFAVSHVAIKGISGSVEIGTGPNLEVAVTEPAGLMGPLGAIVILSGVLAFYASARSLQLGEAVPVIAVTGIAGNVLPILGGVLVFGDPIGDNGLEIIVRVGAFLLLVAAAAMIPGPLRAAHRDVPSLAHDPRRRYRSAVAALRH
jgi:drug/metabolite transporter (DMT)-like permease